MDPKEFLCRLGFIGLAALVILGLPPAPAAAQPVASGHGAVIQPRTQLEIPPPRVRTWQEMEVAAALEAAGPPPPPRMIPFRPTMDAATYGQLKANAGQIKAPAPAAPQAPLAAPLAPTSLTNPVNFDGVQSGTGTGQAGLFYPPDTEGAVGLDYFVEITNSHLDIYQKASPNNRVNGNGVSLSAFFAYSTESLFDPRVMYDSVYGRWVVSADAFAESATVQWFFFAVSQTSDPTGAFYIYQVNVSDGNGAAGGVEWDFPQLGMDQNALIFTANFFDKAGTYTGAQMFTVAKSIVYAGQTLTPAPHIFTGLTGTLAPPKVLDTNPNTYLVAAPITASSISLYTLTNSAGNPPTLNGPVPIPVPTYTAPANAPQPGTPALLDTSDARFVNASTQIGNSLFQVHSISISPTSLDRAICRFYEFNTVNNLQVIQSGTFSRSSTSYDFNASIAANRHKDVFVTWSATDPNNPDPVNQVNAEVRFSGRLHTDPLGVIPSPGSWLFGSATYYYVPGTSVKNQRWGDYSAVSLDPSDHSGATAWIVNERTPNASSHTNWGSRIGSIRLPVKTPLPFVDLMLLGD